MTLTMKKSAWLLLSSATLAGAQWLNFPTPGMPRTADGKPNLTATAPRLADKPDLSGLWRRTGDKYSNNIAADLKPGDVLPWADALYQERKLSFGKDFMSVKCLPWGPAYIFSPFQEVRIVQTPSVIVILNDDLTHREIWMDGRKLEDSPNPTWMGYSVGRWEGDTLVVESNGYNDKTWLDADGHPHTEDLRIVERYTRRDFGHLDAQIVLTDPKTFRAPVSINMALTYHPDTEALEFVCENERDGAHMMTSAQKQIELPVEDLRKFVGTYDVVDLGNHKHKAVVELSDNRLLVDYDDEGKQPVTPFTATRFSLAGTWIEFTPQPSGGMEMLIRYVEGDERGPRR